MLLCVCRRLIFAGFYAAQTLPEMQASLFGKRRILPALPRTLYVESGILDERRLPLNDDGRAAASGAFILAVFVYGNFLSMNFLEKLSGEHGNFAYFEIDAR